MTLRFFDSEVWGTFCSSMSLNLSHGDVEAQASLPKSICMDLASQKKDFSFVNYIAQLAFS